MFASIKEKHTCYKCDYFKPSCSKPLLGCYYFYTIYIYSFIDLTNAALVTFPQDVIQVDALRK